MQQTTTIGVVFAEIGSTMSNKGVPKIFRDMDALRECKRASDLDQEYSMHFSWPVLIGFRFVQLTQPQLTSLKKNGEMWANELTLIEPSWWMKLLERYPYLRFGRWK